jgi:broad specificity phosphatase PhoE
MLQMKKTIIFALLLALSVALVSCDRETKPDSVNETTTFILVRHAEKMSDEDDPKLTEEGVDRALMLSDMVSMANVSTIYSTNYQRTKATVQPVSEMTGVPVTIYEPVPKHEVTEEWINKHRGETVLISGHSNTIPDLANQLLLRTHFDSHFDETDYGNLLIITVNGSHRSLLHLRY